mmetsp:Transcript_3260/g.6676  ORF Transcript_3260/g.6676 Transcript_3260/m.6676 type:complete len:80 (-) Transcript_3260:2031-2270(-)
MNVPSGCLVFSGSSIKSNRGLAGEEGNTATLTRLLSKSAATSLILPNFPIGTKYSSVSNDPNHLACAPNLIRQELSAAY